MLLQVVIAQPPLAQPVPALPTTPHVINIRTVDSGLRPGQVVVCQGTPTHPTVRVVQSTDPQGSRTPVTTKVIRIPQAQANSLLQRAVTGGAPLVAGQAPNGQRFLQRVVSSGAPGSAGRIITISRVANGSGITPQTKNIIVTPQRGVAATAAVVSQAPSTKSIIVTTQAANGGGSVAKRIFVTHNGQSLGPMTTSANGQVLLASLGQSSHQLLQGGGGQRLLINQANGQVLRVTPAPAGITLTSPGTSTTRVVSAIQDPARQLHHSPSMGQLQSIARTVAAGGRGPVGSPMHILSKAGLAGAKVITASSAPSPGPAPVALHPSPSMPLLTNGGARSSSNPPVYSMANIPTVVSQKVNVGNIGSLSVVAGGVPVKQPVTTKELNRLWSIDEMRNRAFAHASNKQVTVGGGV